MSETSSNNTVLLGLSGGVDSAVAALLLQERGFRVVGIFMNMWSDTKDVKGECTWKQERRDAYAVGAKLGIPVIFRDFEDVYRREVMEEFFAAYARGETPNPDVLCNSKIKFPLLRQEADKLGISLIATGHYVRKTTDKDGVHHLLSGIDAEKDQSYFLAGLSQEDLVRTLFPIGDFVKKDIRAKAESAGIPVWDKRSTRGICFVGKVGMPDFLRQKIEDKPGKILTLDGKVVGEHTGVHQCTIGQRHGFGGGGGEPYFVVRKDVATQTLFVSTDEKDLFASEATVRDFHWIAGVPKQDTDIVARIRYRTEVASVKIDGDRLHFEKPQRAVTPGQVAVFYENDECLGSAIIL